MAMRWPRPVYRSGGPHKLPTAYDDGAHHVDWIATSPEQRPKRLTISFHRKGWDLQRLLSGTLYFCLFCTGAYFVPVRR
jgi:hypothetical protein